MSQSILLFTFDLGTAETASRALLLTHEGWSYLEDGRVQRTAEVPKKTFCERPKNSLQGFIQFSWAVLFQQLENEIHNSDALVFEDFSSRALVKIPEHILDRSTVLVRYTEAAGEPLSPTLFERFINFEIAATTVGKSNTAKRVALDSWTKLHCNSSNPANSLTLQLAETAKSALAQYSNLGSHSKLVIIPEVGPYSDRSIWAASDFLAKVVSNEAEPDERAVLLTKSVIPNTWLEREGCDIYRCVEPADLLNIGFLSKEGNSNLVAADIYVATIEDLEYADIILTHAPHLRVRVWVDTHPCQQVLEMAQRFNRFMHIHEASVQQCDIWSTLYNSPALMSSDKFREWSRIHSDPKSSDIATRLLPQRHRGSEGGLLFIVDEDDLPNLEGLLSVVQDWAPIVVISVNEYHASSLVRNDWGGLISADWRAASAYEVLCLTQAFIVLSRSERGHEYITREAERFDCPIISVEITKSEVGDGQDEPKVSWCLNSSQNSQAALGTGELTTAELADICKAL